MVLFVAREEITSTDWSMQLDAPQQLGSGIGQVVQGLADVAQCIQIIVTTPLGSDPLRPDFGCDIFAFLDRPLPLLRPHAVRSVVDAITRWEPRVIVLGVDVDLSAAAAGAATITITWVADVSDPASVPTRTVVALPLKGAGN